MLACGGQVVLPPILGEYGPPNPPQVHSASTLAVLGPGFEAGTQQLWARTLLLRPGLFLNKGCSPGRAHP
jgi:hypothetical protein